MWFRVVKGGVDHSDDRFGLWELVDSLDPVCVALLVEWAAYFEGFVGSSVGLEGFEQFTFGFLYYCIREFCRL